MLLFKGRMLLVDKYEKWISEKRKTEPGFIECALTFIVFLYNNDLLNEEKVKKYVNELKKKEDI